eukprot:13862.XXX_257668_253458_1 [CDS] Oithona nana genome sequencing.
MFVGGVRGMSGAIKMERSEHERAKYPDRINLDRKGLHSVPILADEPDLRLISLQHNSIKRIQHLDTTFRLVFLDLYHNRLEQITGVESLTNLRVLMLGKNRIKRIEGLQRCCRLSVLDLHGNRITQINGLDNLAELKILNLAGNQIRKICNLQGLVSLEELNIRRNRIRNLSGLDNVSLLKLFISNNELATLATLAKLECLEKLHTIQMEGNPVWSLPDYTHFVVSALPHLKVLDQQEITTELRANAAKWKISQASMQTTMQSQLNVGIGSSGGIVTSTTSSLLGKSHLMKKLEERNVCISNAKQRWSFLRTTTLDHKAAQEQPSPSTIADKLTKLEDSGTPPKIISQFQDGEENSDGDLSSSMMTTTETDCTISPTISHQHLALSRQASRSSLMSMKLTLPNSGPGSPTATSSGVGVLPTTASGPVDLKKKFPGLERRKFALPQKFVSLQSIENIEAQMQNDVRNSRAGNSSNKIGFFHLNQTNDDASSSEDEYSGGGFQSDSSSDSTTSESDDGIVFPRDRSQASSVLSQISSSGNTIGGGDANDTGGQTSRPPIWCRSRSPKIQSNSNLPSNLVMQDTGRTVEQGRDFLIELDGDLVNVFGAQALKFLDRPWNKQRSLKATSIQFNFVSFDDLVPYLSRLKQNFPNLANFEFLETDIRTMSQLNALALLQGLSSLIIGKEGNPITNKTPAATLDWRLYAIYRLEHWGLSSVNNMDITDEEILQANRVFGSLGELAVMVLPQTQINNLIKRLDIANIKDQDSCLDYMAAVKDGHLKEILAKEILTYDAPGSNASNLANSHSKLDQLMKGAHASFHKIGRLEDEWPCILPILIKRIVLQYADITRYKKESLCRLEKPK